MDKEQGQSSGPPEKVALSQEFFSELIKILKSHAIDEDDAQDIAQNAAIEGWYSFNEQKAHNKSVRSWIKYILREQAIPKYFRDQKHVFKGIEIPKAEKIESLTVRERESLSNQESYTHLDRAAIYALMKKQLSNEKQVKFLDAELKARESTSGKQVIKQAAKIARIPVKDARNLHRQIVAKLKSSPDLIGYMRD